MIDKTALAVHKQLLTLEATKTDDCGRILEEDYYDTFPALSENELDDWLEYLVGIRFIRLIRYQNSDAVYGISITHEGRHYKEFKWLETREKWIERLIGFAMGVASSLIFWWLTNS